MAAAKSGKKGSVALKSSTKNIKQANKASEKISSKNSESESESNSTSDSASDSESEEDADELNLEALNESEGDDDEDEEENLFEQNQENDAEKQGGEDNEDEEEDEEEDVPLSEAEFDSDADVVPHTKLTVNNKVALKESLARIQINWEKYPFDEGQSLTYDNVVESEIKDIYDDTERELAFFKQGLHAAIEGRKRLLALKIPFTRPDDYFAEMVKSDEHMDKLKAKLISEATEKKAREEARRQRQLKKFGKQVQHETLQQRQKEKRETLEKIKSMKKKRKNNDMSGGDDFDIAVEEASKVGTERQREKKQKIRQNVSSKSSSKSRPGKNRRRNKKK